MRRIIYFTAFWFLTASCGEALEEPFEDSSLGDPTRASISSLTKGSGGTNGASDYCNDPAFPCASGEGDCDSADQCIGDLICAADNGPKFGMPELYDVCVPSHCTNGVFDGDETQLDCGGSCGSICQRTGTNGDGDYCDDSAFPCDIGEGDCDVDSHCLTGLICVQDNGAQFGFAGYLDFCAASHCDNGVLDGDETGVDCGGSCGSCVRPGSIGDSDYCDDPNYPCDIGEGDCDVNSHCLSGLICVQNNGKRFGYAEFLDFCVADHCNNGVSDGDETGIDCGGSCGDCVRSGTNGGADYCNDPNFPCAIGEGDCDVDSHCQTGLICVQNNGAKFGFDDYLDFCAADHCANGVSDGDETGIDCGGSCGSCVRSGSIGDADYCNDPNFPCDAGEGDCDVDSHCSTGNVCVQDNGADWGFDPTLDFCEAAHCTNGVLDGDEFSIDCGGSCGSCDAFAIGSSEFNAVRGVDVLADDSIIVGGVFTASTDFGGETIVPAGDRDGFIARYSANGALQWVIDVASTGFDDVNHVRNVGSETLVAGRFSDSVTIGNTNLTAQGGIDIFIASIADDGTVNWAEQYGGLGNENVFGLDTDSSGNIVISGSFDADIDLGNGSRTSAGFQDVFVAKFDSVGQPLWDYPIGNADTDYIGEVAVDGNGDIWTTGAFFNTLDFGGGPLTSTGSADAFLLKLSESGLFLAAERFGSTGVDVGRGVHRAGASGVVFTGAFSGSVNFLGASLVSVGGKDMFLADISSAMTVNWVTRLGGSKGDEGRHVSVRDDGVILLSGIFGGNNTEIGTGTFDTGGAYDAFTTQYSASGAFLGGTRLYTSSRDDFVTDTAWRSGSDYVSVGYFGSTGSFAGNQLVVANGTKSDGFIVYTQ